MKDIRGLPIETILSLPDFAFGRKFIVGKTMGVAAVTTEFNLITTGLPRKFILWEMNMNLVTGAVLTGLHVGLRYANVVPATDAAFVLGERLFPEYESDANTRQFTLDAGNPIQIRNLKMYFDRTERFICARVANFVNITENLNLVFTISRIPHEVPDWMI